MAPIIKPLNFKPLPTPATSKVNFGVQLENVNLQDLSESDFSQIQAALYTHSIIVIKNQNTLTPYAQYNLTKKFEPSAESYGHGKTLDAKRSVLHADLKTIPHQPQVQVIGNGFFEEYEGLKNITLKHPHHRAFHQTRIPDDLDLSHTRFYRWHIDAALYGLNVPKVTTLLAIKVPKGRRQILQYDDGSGETMDVPLGTTAFVSGQTMYELLTPQDKEFVRSAKVEYAPHPYIWMSAAASRSDGLGMISEDKELPYTELPPIDFKDIKILPMAWKNPVTGKLHLVIHPSAIRAIHMPDGTVNENLEEVREIVHRLQRPGISPQYVYPHDWEEGDLVLFHNQGLIHSVVGAFSPEEKRLFRQCNLASSEGVRGPDDKLY